MGFPSLLIKGFDGVPPGPMAPGDTVLVTTGYNTEVFYYTGGVYYMMKKIRIDKTGTIRVGVGYYMQRTFGTLYVEVRKNGSSIGSWGGTYPGQTYNRTIDIAVNAGDEIELGFGSGFGPGGSEYLETYYLSISGDRYESGWGTVLNP